MLNNPHVTNPPVDDAVLAQRIVKIIFKNVNLCLINDRSKTKLGRFEKAVISGMLGDATLEGINGYIMNMYPNDIKNLINEIKAAFNGSTKTK